MKRFIYIKESQTILSNTISNKTYNNPIINKLMTIPATISHAIPKLSPQVSSDSFERNHDNNTDEAKLIAHRGYYVDAPENSVIAFEEAKKHGFDTIEFDIEWTKDNVPVVIHDSVINRTARNADGSKVNGLVRCSSKTHDELLEYDFGIAKDSKFKGTKILTFSETLDCAKDNNLNMYIELKHSNGFNEERAKFLMEEVKARGLSENVTWISFQPEYLKLISEQDPNARLGYLKLVGVGKNSIKKLNSLKNGSNDVFFDLRANSVGKRSIDLINKAGAYFEAWAVNNGKKYSRMLAMGCKAMTTDKITQESVKSLNTSI